MLSCGIATVSAEKIYKMRILFIPNWNVKVLPVDDESIQAPDKYVKGVPYWFFRYFPDDTQVDVIGIVKDNLLRKVERKLKFYISQPIKAFMMRNNYDLVISHGAQSGLVYELLTTFVKRKPKHVMFDVGGLNGARINHVETPLIRFAMRKSPAIIVHSSRQLGLYRNHYPNLAEKAVFIPFGVDFDYFSKPQLTSIKKRVVAFGYAKRDFSTLCKAFDAITDSEYTLHIIGDTSLVTEFAHNPMIVFHKRMPISDLMKFVAESAIVAIPLPEYQYSYGQMSFLQSMAMRKPMIVTDTTSSHDYIAEAPGVLSPRPYDVDDMKDCLMEMIGKSGDELQRLGEENAEYVKAHFNEAQMGKSAYEFVKKQLD